MGIKPNVLRKIDVQSSSFFLTNFFTTYQLFLLMYFPSIIRVWSSNGHVTCDDHYNK